MSLFGMKEKIIIAELKNKINTLQKEIINLKDKEEELIKISHKKDTKIKKLEKISKSPHDRQFEKITLEFDKVKTENINLKNSNKDFELENLELLKTNHEITQKIKEIEKTIDNLKKENKALKESKKLKVVKKTPKVVKKEFKYKLLIKDLYSARKHDEFKKICKDLGYIYVNELENLNFEKLIEDGISKTKINNAKNEYIKFKNNEFNPDIEEYLTYGHRLSKIFFRYRTFVSYLTEKKIKYLYQLEDFDFETLKEENFTPTQIEKLKEKTIEYNKLRKK